MIKKNLLNESIHQECLDRINNLTPDTLPGWGKMNSAQMLSHCAEIQEVMTGKALEGTPWIAKLFKGMIRAMVMSEKPYPKNARTHPQYVMTGERVFEAEKGRLLAALRKLASLTEEERRQLKHSLFGPMSDEDLGWSCYKHLDHHLAQFGV